MRETSCRRGGSKAIPVLAGLVVLLAAAGGVTQAPSGDDAPAAKPLPEGLRHVPADAMGFIHFRVGDFLKSEIGKALATHLLGNADTAKMVQAVEREIGMPLGDIDSVTLLMLEPAFLDMMFEPGRAGVGGGRTDLARPSSFAPPPIFEKGVPDLPLPPPPKEAPKEPEKKPDSPFGPEESPVSLQPEIFPEDLMMLSAHGGWGPLVILTTTKPVERRTLLRRFVLPEQRPENRLDGPFSRREASVLFLSDRSFLLGPALEIWRYTDLVGKGTRPGRPAVLGKGAAAAARPTAPLRKALALGAERHLVVAGGQFAGLKNLLLLSGRGIGPGLLGPGDGPEIGAAATLFPLLNVASAALTLDLDRSADLKIRFYGSNLKSAALAAEAAKTGLVLLDLGIERLMQDKGTLLSDDPSFPLIAELLKKTRKTLATATVKQDDATVLVHLRGQIDPKTISQAVAALVGEVRKASDRTSRSNNLKQIALAMHNYHDSFGRFPPAALSSVKNKDGKPLLSWRVAILPFIEQDQLYRQFDLELPWDHPHNKKLIDKMPEIYLLPGIKTKDPGLTHYQVLVGPGTPFEPRKGPPHTGIRMTEILDGTSNTIMVVEAAEPVIWTKPDDVPYDPKLPVPKMGPFRDGFYAALCDGSVRFIRRNVNEQTLRALITRNGGEVVPGDFDR